MATSHASVLYDVNDFKVTPLLTDSVTSPTYGATLVDVPGIASVSMEPNINTNELKGDAKVIAKKGNIDKANFSATYGRLALDALAVFLGGTVTDATTPASAKWSLPGTNSLPYFKALFQILQNEVGDVHVTAHKAQVTGGTLLDQSTDSFGQPKIDFEAIPCTSDDTKFVEITFLDAPTPLA
jgi:hypothetical protein